MKRDTAATDINLDALPGPDDILRAELDNGVTVLVRENFTSPSVVVDGRIATGAILEPPGKAGLVNFLTSVVMRGTAHHTFDELYEEIEANGASLDVRAGGHTTRFGSKSLAEDLPRMLNLTAEVMREPTFPPEHVERVRGQLMTSLQLRAHNTRAMATLRFLELAYPDDHPYRTSLNGYPETVQAITRDDLVDFHRNYGPAGAIIVIVGAVKAAEAVEMVADAFGDWQNPDQPPLLAAPPAPRIDAPRESFTPIPGKSQTDLVLGYPGPERTAEDFQAARMANSVLGVFGMYGRLGDVVRQAQGLAYYSYSSLTGGLGPGPWRVIAGVAPENVARAVESIRDEIRRLINEPVGEDELADNRAFFKGQLVLGLEQNEGVAGSLMSMETYNLGLDYLRRYPAIIDALTPAEIQAAAAHYLDPDAYALAVAGPDQQVEG
jgi:zinc protease